MSVRRPEEFHEHFAREFFEHDIDALIALYADDAIMIPGPGEAPVQGLVEIREALSGLLALDPCNGFINTILCIEQDGFALLRSAWKFDATGPDGEPMELSGAGIEVVKRLPGGNWVQVFDNPWGGGKPD